MTLVEAAALVATGRAVGVVAAAGGEGESSGTPDGGSGEGGRGGGVVLARVAPVEQEAGAPRGIVGVVLEDSRGRAIAERVRIAHRVGGDEGDGDAAEGEHAEEAGEAVELGLVRTANPKHERLPVGFRQHHALEHLEDGGKLAGGRATRLGQLVEPHRVRRVDARRAAQPLGHRSTSVHDLDRVKGCRAGRRRRFADDVADGERVAVHLVVPHLCRLELRARSGIEACHVCGSR